MQPHVSSFPLLGFMCDLQRHSNYGDIYEKLQKKKRTDASV